MEFDLQFQKCPGCGRNTSIWTRDRSVEHFKICKRYQAKWAKRCQETEEQEEQQQDEEANQSEDNIRHKSTKPTLLPNAIQRNNASAVMLPAGKNHTMNKDSGANLLHQVKTLPPLPFPKTILMSPAVNIREAKPPPALIKLPQAAQHSNNHNNIGRPTNPNTATTTVSLKKATKSGGAGQHNTNNNNSNNNSFITNNNNNNTNNNNSTKQSNKTNGGGVEHATAAKPVLPVDNILNLPLEPSGSNGSVAVAVAPSVLAQDFKPKPLESQKVSLSTTTHVAQAATDKNPIKPGSGSSASTTTPVAPSFPRLRTATSVDLKWEPEMEQFFQQHRQLVHSTAGHCVIRDAEWEQLPWYTVSAQHGIGTVKSFV
jgi:hypothetical protein